MIAEVGQMRQHQFFSVCLPGDGAGFTGGQMTPYYTFLLIEKAGFANQYIRIPGCFHQPVVPLGIGYVGQYLVV